MSGVPAVSHDAPDEFSTHGLPQLRRQFLRDTQPFIRSVRPWDEPDSSTRPGFSDEFDDVLLWDVHRTRSPRRISRFRLDARTC